MLAARRKRYSRQGRLRRGTPSASVPFQLLAGRRSMTLVRPVRLFRRGDDRGRLTAWQQCCCAGRWLGARDVDTEALGLLVYGVRVGAELPDLYDSRGASA